MAQVLSEPQCLSVLLSFFHLPSAGLSGMDFASHPLLFPTLSFLPFSPFRSLFSLDPVTLVFDSLNRLQRVDHDLLHPSSHDEQSQHKLKRLVQSPNSYFVDVKCPGCHQMSAIFWIYTHTHSFFSTSMFSHASTVVTCGNCNQVIGTPTGGKARLSHGCEFRVKKE